MPSRGDVVSVRYFFTDGRNAKIRPAVVISSDAYHATRHDVVLAAITGNVLRMGFVGYLVLNDWRECGLSKASAISGIIMTFRDSQILGRLGSLSDNDRAAMDKVLSVALEL
jgi:mRNA interferase MazF